MRLILLAGAFAGLIFQHSASAQTKSLGISDNPNNIAAKINGFEINMSRVDQALDAYANDLGQLDPKSFYFSVLERIIDQELAAQAAVSAGIADDPRVKAELDQARSTVLAGAYLTKIASEASSETELLRRYEALKKVGVKSVSARHILVKTEKEAEDIIQKLEEGAAFEELAKAFSVGPSGPRGGDLGFFGPGQMVQPFQEAAFALEVGSHTKTPVKTRFGFHVIKVEDIRSEPPPPFEQAKQKLSQEARTQAMIKELERLHSEAKIQLFSPDGSEVKPTQKKPR
jgi:peptidyl-prolyl cis-trans isomerase C